ncbi:MAG: Fic family protein [Lactobacillaceae bacterium]|jgi:fido (protein-threonine AMPylation protein)|nr:Fic family protein [Lactobacillaceae bacterium]
MSYHEYDREKQPEEYQKQQNWEIGFGLQAADHLTPSKYLVELSKDNIEGKKDYQEIEKEIHKYYAEKQEDKRTMEADVSAIRISEILASDAFTFNPGTLKSYHRRLFQGIPEFTFKVGEYRKVNITKSELILAGNTVNYSDYQDIEETLNWDFTQEATKQYQNMNQNQIVKSVTTFISGIWQIHPFREGNTRTSAVFLIKYLRSLGFPLDNEPFSENSLYFRDALVLDNATLQYKNSDFIDKFMANTVLGETNDLSAREMFLDQIVKRTPEIASAELIQQLNELTINDEQKLAKILALEGEKKEQFLKSTFG